MSNTMKSLLLWAPRVLGAALAFLVSIFALDVFEEGRGIQETAWALWMHLIPAFLLLAVLAVAWRWAWVGAVGYGGLAALYAVWARQHPVWILEIGGPAFLVAALFLLSWLKRRGSSSQAGGGAQPAGAK